MADLVERLRALKREIELRWTGEFAENAVNTLDAVDTRITALEAMLGPDFAPLTNTALRAKVAALEAEIARKDALLEKVAQAAIDASRKAISLQQTGTEDALTYISPPDPKAIVEGVTTQ